jgi:hypothetical protein
VLERSSRTQTSLNILYAALSGYVWRSWAPYKDRKVDEAVAGVLKMSGQWIKVSDLQEVHSVLSAVRG